MFLFGTGGILTLLTRWVLSRIDKTTAARIEAQRLDREESRADRAALVEHLRTQLEKVNEVARLAAEAQLENSREARKQTVLLGEISTGNQATHVMLDKMLSGGACRAPRRPRAKKVS